MMQDVIFSLTQNEFLLSLICLMVTFCLIVIIGELYRRKYDEQIKYFVNLINSKPEKKQDEIMKTLLIGLALSNASERRLLRIITDSRGLLDVQTKDID